MGAAGIVTGKGGHISRGFQSHNSWRPVNSAQPLIHAFFSGVRRVKLPRFQWTGLALTALRPNQSASHGWVESKKMRSSRPNSLVRSMFVPVRAEPSQVSQASIYLPHKKQTTRRQCHPVFLPSCLYLHCRSRCLTSTNLSKMLILLKVCSMAFANELVIIASTLHGLKLRLDHLHRFLQPRGLK